MPRVSVSQVTEDYYKNLPVITINTQNRKYPENKVDYVNCSFKISNCKDEGNNFEVSMKENYGDEDSVGIRLRGNSTLSSPKQPFRIKFSNKHSLLGLQKNKSWVLLADYNDQSAIRNYTAFSMGELFDNLDFTPTPNHVVLFLNDRYMGLYLLTEQVDEKSGRTNVDEDFDASADNQFPFLIEMDRAALGEGVTGVDNFQIEGLYPMEIKYPESDERGILSGQEDVVFNYIKEYMTAVYTSLKTGESVTVSWSEAPVSFEDLVDVNSLIDYHLLNEFMLNQDSTWGSIYMHKTKTGKLQFGPVWDFDWSCSVSYPAGPYQYSEIEAAQNIVISRLTTFFNFFLQKESNFSLVKNRWNEIASKWPELNAKLRAYKSVISTAAKYDAKLWYGETGAFQFDFQYDYVRLFLCDRVEFLSKAFNMEHSEFLNLINS